MCRVQRVRKRVSYKMDYIFFICEKTSHHLVLIEKLELYAK